MHISLTPAYPSHAQLLPDLLRALFPMVLTVLAAVAVVIAVRRLGTLYRSSRSAVSASGVMLRRSRLGASRLRAYSIDGGVDELGVQVPARARYRAVVARKGFGAREARRLVDSLEKVNAVDGNGICAICLDEFGTRGAVVRLPCRHEFDEMCVLTWFRKGAASCPYCNLRLDEGRGRSAETAMETSVRDASGLFVSGWHGVA